MATYKITAPDGKQYMVQGPPGMSPAQVKYQFTQTQLEPEYSPTEGGMDNALAGMGKAFVDTGRGVGQLAGVVSDEQIAESRRLDEPLMDTTGGFVGNMAGHMAQLPVGGASLKGAVGLGAGYSALQPGSLEERAMAAATGGAAGGAGQVAGQAIGHMLQPGRQVMPQAQKLIDQNIPLSPADQTGSRVLHVAEETLANTAGGMKPAQAFRDAQQTGFNRAVLNHAGINADRATPDVVNAAYDNVSKTYNRLVGDRTVDLTEDWLVGVNDIQQINTSLPESLRSGKITNLAADMYEMGVGGPVPAKELQATRSALAEMERSLRQTGKRPEMRRALNKAINMMDDAVEKDLPPALQKQFQQTRKNFYNLKRIEPNIDADGNISPSKLANNLKSKDKELYARGFSELNELAKAGKSVLPAKLGSSGTSERQAMARLLGSPDNQQLLGGASGFGVGGPMGAVMGYAAPVALPYAARRAMFSPAGTSYLTQGIPGTAGAVGPLKRLGAASAISGLLSSQQAEKQ